VVQTVALMVVQTVALMAVQMVALMVVQTTVEMIQQPRLPQQLVMVRQPQPQLRPRQQRRLALTSLVAIDQKAGLCPAFLVMISACPIPPASDDLLA
jgi:hypothetical protein